MNRRWTIILPDRRFDIALLIFILVTLPGCQKETETNELLLAKPPNGWKRIYQINSQESRLTDYIPEDEDSINWISKISFESFANFDEADPIEVTLDEAREDRKNCSFVQHFNLFSGTENNYPSSIRLFMCGKHNITEKGEVKMIKAIRGEKYFYVIRLNKRIPAFSLNQAQFDKSEIAAWANYMKNIRLCHITNPEHPCKRPEDNR